MGDTNGGVAGGVDVVVDDVVESDLLCYYSNQTDHSKIQTFIRLTFPVKADFYQIK